MPVENIQDKAVGKSNLDPNSFGIDTFGFTNTHKLAPLNPSLNGTPLNINTPYGSATIVKNDIGSSAVETSRNNNAPNANNPTIASAPPGMSLPNAISKIDPNGTAFSLNNLFQLLSLVKSIMNTNNPISQQKIVTQGFSGALQILSHRYTFEYVINKFEIPLLNNGINYINEEYQDIVKEGLTNLIQLYIQYGNNIPVPYIPKIVYGNIKPLNDLIVYSVPDLYIQQYYSENTDPYPGYIQWIGPSGNYLYTLRTSTQYPYSSVDEEILRNSELQIANLFDTYFLNQEIITTNAINNILNSVSVYVSDTGLEKHLGNNSSSNILKLLPQLMGLAGNALNISQSVHLPNSVLNNSVVSNAQENFSKSIALAKLMQSKSSGAFNIPSALSTLSTLKSTNTIPSISNILKVL